MHIPGVIETKKKVGMNILSNARFISVDDLVIKEKPQR
ncbi:hypothetical protein A79_3718 [Vibrio parahaemolyticus AQ3810]|nr:hypothetical protein V12G01_01865 [Vibrio alginolyticus 12G01]EDM60343.1 hypothetical protein A79_3718 [Vibrio parahaemolyticus AQ3810]EQM01153.1 hypothetical protein D019_3112 [Vibrio parahaemolyticus VP2007-095]EQM43032.1 hypothetical protein D025_2877 [Vibrio parahaemolyticus 949]ESV69789.1 hypothetical protein D021_1048 [Vibrio parahaemolyticus 10296]ETJ89723.1 hypothetical protein D029_1922 [Vibrio parahaemolyticus 970107]ETX22377.1 hypothetical protein D037_3926 [Vibrio parahaemolyti